MAETGATDSSSTDEGSQTQDTSTEGTVDYAQEVEKWKKHSRTWEERSKANVEKAKAYDNIVSSGEQDKANAALAAAQKDANDAKREAAMYRAAITNDLTAEDLQLLSYVPLEQLDEAAKNLAARLVRKGPNLGQGVGQAGAVKNDMNSMMRRAAGLSE